MYIISLHHLTTKISVGGLLTFFLLASEVSTGAVTHVISLSTYFREILNNFPRLSFKTYFKYLPNGSTYLNCHSKLFLAAFFMSKPGTRLAVDKNVNTNRNKN